MSVTPFGGIVLCGGRSSRMGRPKAWLPFGDELMLQRVVRVLREVVDPVVVVAAPGQDVPPLPPDVEIVRDEVEGKGPLGGLAAGLAALEGKADAAYLSSCDVPFLKPEFVRRVDLRLLRQPAYPVLPVPRGGGISATRSRPSYRSTVLFRTSANCSPPTACGRCSSSTRVPTRVIEPHELADVDPEFASLRNLNTPDEYEAALRELARTRPG